MSTDVLSLPDPETLPDDPALLKQLVLQLLELLRDKDARTEAMQNQIDWLTRRVFGRTSEKLDPRQMALFEKLTAEQLADEQDLAAALAATSAESPDGSQAADESPTSGESPPVEPPAKPKRKGHGRRPKPGNLKRVERTCDLSEAEKQALGGGGTLVLIGEEITEHYEWEPSCLYIVRNIQKKYARRPLLLESGAGLGEKNIFMAPKRPLPIPGGIAGPGLLAQIIVSHHLDHLPFHRQSGITARFGQLFSRQTIDGWSLACADLLTPLYGQMQLEVLGSRVLGSDDTLVKVRDAQRKLQYTGRFWVYLGDERHPLTVFDFTTDRSRDGPEKFLKGYRGYLQADAYSAYDGIFIDSHGGIIEVACWAHARRKFFENQKANQLYALTALGYIRQLYEVERVLRGQCADDWRELPLEERAARIAAERQAKSKPVLDAFKTWLDNPRTAMLPKNPLHEAAQYTLNHWQALNRYLEDGQLAIDNNAVERALRLIAIGRKNWLFRGSERGGKAAAVHFSILVTCQHHGLDPLAYLTDVLDRLASMPNPTPEQLQPLLPHRYRPSPA